MELDCYCSVAYVFHLLVIRYKLCEPLELVCAQCFKKYAFTGVSEILASRATSNETPSTGAACPDPLMCAECNRSGGLNRVSPAMLANQVLIFPMTYTFVSSL